MAQPSAADLSALEKAVNDAASKASVLWLSFVSFATLLAITLGTVTHRHLLLELPLRLPVLNVELPLVAFFVTAPVFFLIFHFYVFLQMHGLARKANEYDRILRAVVPDVAGRRSARQRLDGFVFLQRVATSGERKHGLTDSFNALMAWMSMAALPVIVLALTLLTFLPYHGEAVTWLHRLLILMDLVLLQLFWGSTLQRDGWISGYRVWGRVGALMMRLRDWKWQEARLEFWRLAGAARRVPRASVAFSLAMMFLATFVAVFPTERIHAWRFSWLSDWLFQGTVNELTGRPNTPFWLSNRLVLPGERLVVPVGKDAAADAVTGSFRGRDLYGAYLDRTDLHQADFSGADLRHAWLRKANLERALFLCRDTDQAKPSPEFDDGTLIPTKSICAKLTDAKLHDANLREARFAGAEMTKAVLSGARLEGASIVQSELADAIVAKANLNGTLLHSNFRKARMGESALAVSSLKGADLSGTNLSRSVFDGADLSEADLTGANLERASFKAAVLSGAQMTAIDARGADFEGAVLVGTVLHGANLESANMSWADLHDALLQGANLDGTRWDGARLRCVYLFRAKRPMLADAGYIQAIDASVLTLPEVSHVRPRERALENIERYWEDTETRYDAVNQWSVIHRLERLKPRFQTAEVDKADQQFWAGQEASGAQPAAYRGRLSTYIRQLFCDPATPAHVRGRVTRSRLHNLEPAERASLKLPDSCAGAKHLSPEDLAEFDKLAILASTRPRALPQPGEQSCRDQ